MKTKNLIPVLNLLVLISFLFFNSCDDAISGSGKIVSETREVGSFNAIEVSGAFTVYIYQGDEEEVMIEADDNLMQYVQTRVRGGRLYLDTRSMGFRRATFKAHITVTDFEEVKASGAIKLLGQTPLEVDRLKVKASGASDIDLEVFGDRLEVKISGAGKGHLTGEVDQMTVKISGASKFSAATMWCRILDINISGAGSANVNVEEKLIAKISGAGNVRYLGDPDVQSKVSGAGKVSRLK